MVKVSVRALSSLPAAASFVLGVGGLLGLGCPSQTEQTSGPKADTKCSKELPAGCKVLKDETDEKKSAVEYHVLLPASTKHGEAQKHMEALYRHLMTRRDSEPTALAGYIYTNEAQFSTPPPSPVATVQKKAGEKAPSFENKIPMELWQQVEESIKISERADRKLSRKLTYLAEPDQGKVTLTMPFTDGTTAEWAKELSLASVMNHFTEFAMRLFNNIPDLKQMIYIAQWKDQEVAHIEVSRADYQRLNLRDVEERIGQLGGRTFLELTTGKGGSDAAVEKAHLRRKNAEYRKIIDALKSQAVVSKTLQ